MSGLKWLARGFLVFGVILLVSGLFMAISPETVERAASIHHSDSLLSGRYSVGPLERYTSSFTVPTTAGSAFLDLDIRVLSGGNRDIIVSVYQGSREVYSVKATGSFSDLIQLPGPGSYTLVLDNSFSLVSRKDVYVQATLRWSELRIEQSQVKNNGLTYMGVGIALLISWSIIHSVYRRSEERPESFDSVLLELAQRKPVEAGGPTVNAVVKLEPHGVTMRDVSKIVDAVSRARKASIYAWKPRLKRVYTLEVRAPRDAALTAARDIVEICERTRRCRASIEKIREEKHS